MTIAEERSTGDWFGLVWYEPQARAAYSWTNYRFGFNNPARYSDPTGMFEYSDGYSTKDTKYETGSVSHSGTFQGNSGDVELGSHGSSTVIAHADNGNRAVVDNSVKPKSDGGLNTDEKRKDEKFSYLSGNFIRSFQPRHEVNWKISFGIGAGWRSKTYMSDGIGGDVGFDAGHGLIYFGNKGSGLQLTLGGAAFQGKFKSETYGGEYYFFRDSPSYVFFPIFNDPTFHQSTYMTPFTGSNYKDQTPSTNIDMIIFEGGFETDYLSELIESIRIYFTNEINRILKPAKNDN